ncbi:ribosome biogenesis protein YTM1 [Hygrophoropsis aurantiaca]|uniref:Ribosome biogenesis protein YTM1 n=1 Tax=Hygrophoropsis aurantiaca TaxID=72124 RepID=A0ACB8A6X6_9AGAM|nr:ribosome biogenesis protein YTM1 [Hygrophoropsis aurantiaca]
MATHPVIFTTKTPYALPSQKFLIPIQWKRYQLSQLINKALSLPNPIPFDFLVRGSDILRGSLGEWTTANGVGEEDTLEIEYFESILPPQRMSTLPHEDWVSSISSQIPQHLLTASYDGHIRLFDYSQAVVADIPTHAAAITSICSIPPVSSPNSSESDLDSEDRQTFTIASASHDLTARLTKISLPLSSHSQKATFQSLATLHLHTLPLSSITADSTGTHLLTASWDGLVGFWDTQVPDQDDGIPASLLGNGEDASSQPKKKRRVAADITGETKLRRKAPLTVFKSHTNRVSKALFGAENGSGNGKAYSCGFDSTVRTWDVEMGVCVDTITASKKPFLDLALTPDARTALAASTDRTVTIYDLRASSLTTSAGALQHPTTVSCIALPTSAHAPSPSATAKAANLDADPGIANHDATISQNQFVTGAYDGIARVWDLRSMRAAVAVCRVWEGKKKILSVDWARGGAGSGTNGMVSVGGEGGVEIWRVG